MAVKLTFLGTGTSQGVPIIGCKCDRCQSSDPRDKRLRSSALVEMDGLTILVDAGPDFRAQMLAAGVSHLDAILLTHNHKDHTGGLDDVRSTRKPRRFSARKESSRRSGTTTHTHLPTTNTPVHRSGTYT